MHKYQDNKYHKIIKDIQIFFSNIGQLCVSKYVGENLFFPT